MLANKGFMVVNPCDAIVLRRVRILYNLHVNLTLHLPNEEPFSAVLTHGHFRCDFWHAAPRVET